MSGSCRGPTLQRDLRQIDLIGAFTELGVRPVVHIVLRVVTGLLQTLDLGEGEMGNDALVVPSLRRGLFESPREGLAERFS